MPELRKDPVTGRWVIIAPERAERPNALLRAVDPPDDGEACPFCPGNESMTPPELLVHREPGEQNGAWALRVVANRFPALRTEERMARVGYGLFDSMAGVGAHEVIIETPEHRRTLAQQPLERVRALFQAAQERMHDLVRDQRLRTIVLFKNSGAPAGATIPHSHSQLVALPIVPVELQAELDGARHHFADKERCIFCDIVVQESRDGARIVHETDGFVALSPFAARSPFETWILPREHRSNFEHAAAAELNGLSDSLRTVLRKMDVALERPAYSFYLHTLPLREPKSDWFHWHLELKPTLTQQGGFEWASGFFINPTPPEEAAAFLRQTEV